MHDVAEQIEVKLFGRVLSGPRPIAAEEIEKIEEDTSEHRAAIEEDIRHGRSSMQIRDEIIAQVGMMAHARPPEMQARYNAALAREKKIDSPDGPIPQAHANGAPL
jgi:hypothetical protein